MSLFETTDMTDTNPKKYIGPKVDPKTGKILGKDGEPLLPDGSNFDDETLHTQDELPDEDKFLGAETPDEVQKKKRKKVKKNVKEGLFTMDDFSSLLESNDQTSYTKREALDILKQKFAKLKESVAQKVPEAPKPVNKAVIEVYRDLGYRNFTKSRINEGDYDGKTGREESPAERVVASPPSDPTSKAKDRRRTFLTLPTVKVSSTDSGAKLNKHGLSGEQQSSVANHAKGVFSGYLAAGMWKTPEGAPDVERTKMFALADTAKHLKALAGEHAKRAYALHKMDPTDTKVQHHLAQAEAAHAMSKHAEDAHLHYAMHGSFDASQHKDYEGALGSVTGAMYAGSFKSRGEEHLPQYLEQVHGLSSKHAPGVFRDAVHSLARAMYDHDLRMDVKNGSFSVRKNETKTSFGGPEEFAGDPLDRTKAQSSSGKAIATKVALAKAGWTFPSEGGSSSRDIKSVMSKGVSRSGGSGESHEEYFHRIIKAAKSKQAAVVSSKEMPKEMKNSIGGGSPRVAGRVFHEETPEVDAHGAFTGKHHVEIPIHLQHIDRDTEAGKKLFAGIQGVFSNPDRFEIAPNVHNADDAKKVFHGNPGEDEELGQRTLSGFPEMKPGEEIVTHKGGASSTLSHRTDVALGVPGSKGSVPGRVRSLETPQTPALTPLVSAGKVMTEKGGTELTGHSGPGIFSHIVLKTKTAMTPEEIDALYSGGHIRAEALHNFKLHRVVTTPTGVRSKAKTQGPGREQLKTRGLYFNTGSRTPAPEGMVSSDKEIEIPGQEPTTQHALDVASYKTPTTGGPSRTQDMSIAGQEADARHAKTMGISPEPSVETELAPEEPGGLLTTLQPGKPEKLVKTPHVRPADKSIVTSMEKPHKGVGRPGPKIPEKVSASEESGVGKTPTATRMDSIFKQLGIKKPKHNKK